MTLMRIAFAAGGHSSCVEDDEHPGHINCLECKQILTSQITTIILTTHMTPQHMQ